MTFVRTALSLTCGPNEYLVNNSACLPRNQPFCLTYSFNSNACSVCQPGYYTMGGKCLPQNVLNCATTVTNRNTCKICNLGYYLGPDSLCYPVQLSNCLAQRANSKMCLVCWQGWLLNPVTGLCSIPQTGAYCLAVTDGTTLCTDCSTGSYPLNGVCTVVNVTNCVDYTPNTNICTKCSPGFTLMNGECSIGLAALSKMVSSCQTYDPAGNGCSVCSAGSYAFNGQCYGQTIAGCKKFANNQNVCTKCIFGMTLAQNGTCISTNPNGCLSFNATHCLSCPPGYQLEPNALKCTLRNVPNCLGYKVSSNKCNMCVPLYHLKNDACVAIKIDNCIANVQNKNECAVCAAGYSVFLTKCVTKAIPFCLQVNNNGKCKNCTDGYHLKAGDCLPQNVPYCASYTDQTNTCIACQTGYSLIKKKCVPNLKTPAAICALTDGTGCALCVNGFFVDSSKNCQPQNIENCASYCVGQSLCCQCKNGFYTTGTECVAITVSNCQLPSGNSNTCLVCNNGYYPLSGQCTQTNVPGCSSFLPNTNNCGVCANGWYRQGTVCVQGTLPYCQTIVNNVCTQCIPGYFKNGQNCSPQNIANCASYFSGTNICTACSSGILNVTANSCNQQAVSSDAITISNCIFQRATKCLQCAPMWNTTLDGTQCIAMKAVLIRFLGEKIMLTYPDNMTTDAAPIKSLLDPWGNGRKGLVLTGVAGSYRITTYDNAASLAEQPTGTLVFKFGDLQNAQLWNVDLVPGTQNQFLIRNAVSSNYITTVGTTSPVPTPVSLLPRN